MWEDWLKPIDLYCERIDSSLWAEPLGFSSNLGFILISIVIAKLAKRAGSSSQSQGKLWLLSALSFAIGIGSALFHAHPNQWTKIGDILPISLFALAAIQLYMSSLQAEGSAIRNRLLIGLGLIVLFPLVIRSIGMSSALAGGDFYFGLAPAMVCFALFDPNRDRARLLLWAALAFACALVARTLDPYLCQLIPSGTHFLWHLLCAIVILLLAKTLLVGKS